MNDLRFQDLQPAAPDLERLAERTAALLAELESAKDLQALLAAVREWDEMRRGVDDYSSMVHLRFAQATADAEIKSELDRWTESEPRWTELTVSVKRALLAHPLRAELESELGAQTLAVWSSETLAFAPEIKDLLSREAALSNEFVALIGGAEIDFQGQTETLATLGRFREDPDRDVRHAAERARWEWFGTQRGAFDRVFDELVQVRQEIASRLGRADFVEVGYDRMCRVDYSREDVHGFRERIRTSVVPLCEELVRRQADELGIDAVHAWDEEVLDPRGNPRPQGDADWQVARAREMFAAMGPELEGFFARLVDGGFVDLVARPNKAGGGFCTSFPGYGMPFIFANFNGTRGDVEVLTHEVGHAFQNWSSSGLFPMDVHWPTFDSAEIHSMSLEFLTWPEMERFFGEHAERFRRVHLTQSLLFLPYGVAVDDFQHEIYTNPELGPAGRHALWLELERTYLPWRRWGDLEHPARGGRWQGQGHIFQSPFYYIDYVLAGTVALQFWELSTRDRAAALEAYLALCKRGGSLPFQALVRSAGLASPFDAGVLENAVEQARRTLDV